jgi:hypothetical protein
VALAPAVVVVATFQIRVSLLSVRFLSVKRSALSSAALMSMENLPANQSENRHSYASLMKLRATLECVEGGQSASTSEGACRRAFSGKP